MAVDINDIPRWIAENKTDFVPPVCNKCMFADQLKVFFVGGPNQRRDFHMEEGEEFFYQQNGDMVLRVVERGVIKDLRIKQGEIFLLPSRVEHSPQRFSDTIGFVVERTRANTEFDCVRYFEMGSTDRLFERWIHLTDVVKDLPPLIREFNDSDECKYDRSGPASFLVHAPYEPRHIALERPINLKQFIEEHKKVLRQGPVEIYGPPRYKTEVILLGEGAYDMETGSVEMLIWIQDVSFSVLEVDKVKYSLQSNAMIRLADHKSCTLEVKHGYAITLRMMSK